MVSLKPIERIIRYKFRLEFLETARGEGPDATIFRVYLIEPGPRRRECDKRHSRPRSSSDATLWPLCTGCAASCVADMEVRMSTKVDVDVTELWREFKEHPTTELRNHLVERYLPLVKYNAERIWQRLPEGVDLDDLISAGVFGLMDAIDAFDLSRGVKFETYCVPRIRGAMLDELRTMDWVPRLVRSKATKMEEARKELEARHGRPPTDVELATMLGRPMEESEKTALDANAVGLISLNKKWYETDSYKDVREIDILED